MTARQITNHGPFQIATVPGRNGHGFLGWAKLGVIVSMHPTQERGDLIWCAYDISREAVRHRLLADLRLESREGGTQGGEDLASLDPLRTGPYSPEK